MQATLPKCIAYSMVSFGRNVERAHSVSPLRVSHQRCHFRVRNLQALRRELIFISLRQWGSICLTLSLPWYCSCERVLEFPLWSAPQTHTVIAGRPGLFSSSINLPWACPHQQSSSVSGGVGAQSTSRSCKPSTQCSTPRIQASPGVYQVHAWCRGSSYYFCDLMHTAFPHQIYWNIDQKFRNYCILASNSRRHRETVGRQKEHWVEHCLGERGMAEDLVYEPKAGYLV